VKFEQLDLSESKPVAKQTKSQIAQISYDNDIDAFYRFGEVGVFVIKDNKKGIFKELSKYINNGKKPCSWTMKLYHDDAWNIQFGVSAYAKDNEFSISSVMDEFASKYGVTVSGYAKVGTVHGCDTKTTQHIVSILLKLFSSVEMGLADFTLYSKYASEESVAFSLPAYASSKRDEFSDSKFKYIIYRLGSTKMLPKDEKNFQVLKSRLESGSGLTDQDKLAINVLMKTYFTEHERVELAMQYLSRGG
jgi:hypothetical protein